MRTVSMMCENCKYPEKFRFNVWAWSDIKNLTSCSSLLEDTVTKMKADFKKIELQTSHSMMIIAEMRKMNEWDF